MSNLSVFTSPKTDEMKYLLFAIPNNSIPCILCASLLYTWLRETNPSKRMIDCSWNIAKYRWLTNKCNSVLLLHHITMPVPTAPCKNMVAAWLKDLF